MADSIKDSARKIGTEGGDYTEGDSQRVGTGGVSINLAGMDLKELALFQAQELLELRHDVTEIKATSSQNAETLAEWRGNGKPGLGERIRDIRSWLWILTIAVILEMAGLALLAVHVLSVCATCGG